MGSATALNQLFKNLCYHSMWKYAILWKFQDENHMLLTCEDSYVIDTQSGIAMDYAQCKEFISSHSWVTSIGCESIIQSGSIPNCSIVVAVCNMTRFSYLLGEGIVGKVASMERHQWICVGGMNSQLLLEYPVELGLQVAAGIKTILLLPVLSLGLVQLGSMDKLSEDLTMVAQLKELFCAYQYTFNSNSTLELRMGQIDSNMELKRPLEKHSTCSEMNTNLTDLKQTQPFTTPDLEALTFDQAMVNEHLSVGSVRLPHSMVQSNDPLTQVGFHQAHGFGTEPLDEIRWNAICSELFKDHLEEQIMLSTSIFDGRTMESDQSLTLHEEVKLIPAICQGLSSKNPTLFDASMKDLLQDCDDFCDFNKANLKFTEEFDVVINSTTDSRNLDFSVESGFYKGMEQNCLLGWNNITWIENQSKANEGGELITSFKAKAPETIGSLLEEPCTIDKNRTEYSTLIAVEEIPSVSDDKKLESCEHAKSHCSSSGRCSDSCLTQCKTEDASNSEDSGLESRKVSLISDSEGFSSYLTACPQRTSVHMPLKNEEHGRSACGFWRSCLKKSQGSNRQVKYKDNHRARPRDRQLIQDRIRELRELIPNASKCSIDKLLDQTVKHMMFLKSVPIHADKLSQSARSKVEDKDSNLQGAQVTENPASLACEVGGTKSTPFPLVVENLDRPDQMLVEMQCRNHGLFFDIAQAIKRLGLTILKGILESRLEELWAHFIVEIPKGFHRMDIVWPLLQLLQLKF
uniref:Transcription factor bHLH155-like isoform X1 n=1 Tax=Cymbidium ensifolium TaxID=78740 RepID=A0A515HG34_CYMEN|nr:transcription factor bHLH155-like isoform X1 [Cymbidium ensifolium]